MNCDQRLNHPRRAALQQEKCGHGAVHDSRHQGCIGTVDERSCRAFPVGFQFVGLSACKTREVSALRVDRGLLQRVRVTAKTIPIPCEPKFGNDTGNLSGTPIVDSNAQIAVKQHLAWPFGFHRSTRRISVQNIPLCLVGKAIECVRIVSLEVVVVDNVDNQIFRGLRNVGDTARNSHHGAICSVAMLIEDLSDPLKERARNRNGLAPRYFANP